MSVETLLLHLSILVWREEKTKTHYTKAAIVETGWKEEWWTGILRNSTYRKSKCVLVLNTFLNLLTTYPVCRVVEMGLHVIVGEYVLVSSRIWPKNSEFRTSEEHLCFCWEHQPQKNEFYLCKMTRVIKNTYEIRKTWGFKILFSLMEPWDKESHYQLVVCVCWLVRKHFFSGSENPHAVVFFA